MPESNRQEGRIPVCDTLSSVDSVKRCACGAEAMLVGELCPECYSDRTEESAEMLDFLLRESREAEREARIDLEAAQ